MLSVSLGLFTLLPPPMTGADEFWHLIRVAAVAGGELTGEREPSGDGWFYEVETPSGYDGRLLEMILCLNVNAAEDARCSGEVPARAPGAHQNPVRQLPAAVLHRREPRHAAGLGGDRDAPGPPRHRAVLAAGTAGLGVQRAAFERRWRWVLCGLAVALTQAVVLAMTTVNPNALEVAAAALLWVALPRCCSPRGRRGAIRAGGGRPVRRSALARPSSLLWVAGIVVAVVLFVGWRRTIAVARTRAGLWPAATVPPPASSPCSGTGGPSTTRPSAGAPLGAGVRALDLSQSELVRRSLDTNFSRVRFIFWGFGDVYAPTARCLALLIGATWAGLLGLGCGPAAGGGPRCSIALALAVPLLSTASRCGASSCSATGSSRATSCRWPSASGPVRPGDRPVDAGSRPASQRLEIARRVLVVASTVLFEWRRGCSSGASPSGSTARCSRSPGRTRGTRR